MQFTAPIFVALIAVLCSSSNAGKKQNNCKYLEIKDTIVQDLISTEHFIMLRFKNVFIVKYEKKLNAYCTPSQTMSSKNLTNAKKECSNNPICHMFYSSTGEIQKDSFSTRFKVRGFLVRN